MISAEVFKAPILVKSAPVIDEDHSFAATQPGYYFTHSSFDIESRAAAKDDG